MITDFAYMENGKVVWYVWTHPVIEEAKKQEKS